MAHFFFNLHEHGTVFTDEEGCDLADATSARARAIDEAREMLCADVKLGRLGLDSWIAVQDRHRREIFRVGFREAVVITG